MRAVVTGATGFLGGALTRRLHSIGWYVTALGRNPLRLNELDDAGIRPLRLDITRKGELTDAFKEQEIVFHCAALPSPWGNYEKFYQANVIGTRNVVQACLENNVKRLVYVSTPSIYFDYNSRLDVKEADPLPEPISAYAATKLLAEEEVDKGFGKGLAVVSIRPRALFGEGDTVIFPRLLSRLKSGRLPILGDGENIVDLTYIQNVVDALLLCAESPSNTLGRKYNISNGEPVKIWELVNHICDELNLPRPKRKVSYRTANAAAAAIEFVYSLIPYSPEPPLTRLTVSMLAHSTTLDISAAKAELGYRPKVSVEEGVERFLKWWKEIHH
ncbi:sterol-4alpha-carboxylate 3-dehydrogenase (decarboxylating) [Anaerolineales bacterium]|nr:sterol-4alpha-carboxylate 3-dehydrogenase (decarboxylating) [Anaerolineales bacterium]